MNPASAGRRSFLWHGLPWIIVLLQLAWWGYGAWPVAPVEGDEQGVLFGVDGLLLADPQRQHLRYSYGVQPGVYPVLAALSRLTGQPAEAVYGAATLAGALAFAVAAAVLLRRFIPWPTGWLMVAMLYCQEVTAAGCYMNTSALAGGIALIALLLAPRPGRLAWLWPGLLLAFAGWLRADSLLIAPACLGLVYGQERSWPRAISRTARIAATAILAFVILYRLSGISVGTGAGEFSQRGLFFSSLRILLEAPFQVFSPALTLAGLAGCWLLVRARATTLLIVVLLGCAGTILAHGSAYTTPKYLYYLVPFALIPALFALERLRATVMALAAPRRLIAGTLLAALALVDNLVGLRTLTDAQRPFTTPTLALLAQFPFGARTFALVIGPGELIMNVDAFRLRTGQGFAPLCWHREKILVRQNLALLREWIARPGDRTLYWSGWLSQQVAVRELFHLGFRPAEPMTAPNSFAPSLWQDSSRTVRLTFLGYIGSPFQAPGLAPASPTEATLFIGDIAGQPLTGLADGRHWELVSPIPRGLITLYQRR